MIYRMCRARKAGVFDHFLDSIDELSFIEELNMTVDMIDEVFARLPSEQTSRFYPKHFDYPALYAAEKQNTTFYEFCYHVLLNQRFTGDRTVLGSLHLLEFTPTIVEDITSNPPDNVMHLSEYSYAHKFVRSLNPLPGAIRYTSVREPDGAGVNYAIFDKTCVTYAGEHPGRVLITPQNNGSAEVIVGKDAYLIQPIF